MSRDPKRPAQASHPALAKKPRQACEECPFSDHHPSWRLGSMDLEGPFGWNRLKGGEVFWSRIFPKLQQFETMRWREIEGRRHHAIAVTQLSPLARQRLAELAQNDVDEVFSLALSGRERIIGIRDRHVFRVLWWDPDHEVCPSLLKHT